MDIVLSTLELGAVGGAATYLLTVAEQLERLGHEVTIFAGEVGDLAAVAQARGLRVVSREGELPADCDVVYAQDAATAYSLADRYPGRPQAICLHAASFDRWTPPQLPGVVGAIVVLHDRMAERAAALALRPEIVRLRQPVDLIRFAPRAAIRNLARRVLLLGNYLAGDRRSLVRTACADAGLECRELGLYGNGTSPNPEAEINDADIVIGHGRSIVEAMACGRAAFVYDHSGGDGWVTPENYARVEALNFAIPTADGLAPPDALADQLRAYRPSMGTANRDLAARNHNALRHAERLVGVLEGLAPTRPPDGAPLRELGRMVRVQWQTEAKALGVAHEARLLAARVEAAEAQAAEAAAARAEAERRFAELRATRRYRFALALSRPLDRLRERRGRSRAAPAPAARPEPQPAPPESTLPVAPGHFHSPIPAVDELPPEVWSRTSALEGLRFDTERGLKLLEGVLAPYLREFAPPRDAVEAAGPAEYHTENGFYERIDADVLHAMIRCAKPRRVIEIGAGWSTLVSAGAVRRNAAEGHPAAFSSFDPHPAAFLAHGVEGLDALHAVGAADIPLETFDELEAGDVLFIDSTHTVKIDGDVNHLILDVLPRLAPGVLVHFHDIFLPHEYPRRWIVEEGWHWAEQYLLQAFLAFNDDYETLLPVAALARAHRDRLRAVFPDIHQFRGFAAYWIQRTGAGILGDPPGSAAGSAGAAATPARRGRR